MSSKDIQENKNSGNSSQEKTVSRESSQGGKQPPKKTPTDFIFGKVIGEGSFSTVSFRFLTFCMLGKNFNRRHFEIFFLFP